MAIDSKLSLGIYISIFKVILESVCRWEKETKKKKKEPGAAAGFSGGVLLIRAYKRVFDHSASMNGTEKKVTGEMVFLIL